MNKENSFKCQKKYYILKFSELNCTLLSNKITIVSPIIRKFIKVLILSMYLGMSKSKSSNDENNMTSLNKADLNFFLIEK